MIMLPNRVAQAKLLQRAAHVAEGLGEHELDRILAMMGQSLTSTVLSLTAARDEPLSKTLGAIVAKISELTQEALLQTSPLILPLCELLSLRADGMARHLVKRMYSSLAEVATVARAPTPEPSGVLLRAGLCLQMVNTGVAQASETAEG